MSDLTTTGLIIAGGQQALIAAKEFASKLLSPAIEEVGLIFKDEVAIYRFKNQIRLLTKTKAICEANDISPKVISPKLLLPLLDHASLEDDEVLQDKWAILLSNLVDSEQNIENHVFPYLLSQISRNEFTYLEFNSLSESKRNIEIRAMQRHSKHWSTPFTFLRHFEFANLIRLGILEKRFDVKPNTTESVSLGEPENILDASYQITELGFLFMKACTEKKKQ